MGNAKMMGKYSTLPKDPLTIYVRMKKERFAMQKSWVPGFTHCHVKDMQNCIKSPLRNLNSVLAGLFVLVNYFL